LVLEWIVLVSVGAIHCTGLRDRQQ